MILLILCDHYVPGYKAGGPIVSLSALIKQLETKVNIVVATKDRDFGDEQVYPGIIPDCIRPFEQHSVYYCSSMFSLFGLIKKVRPDVIYCNSLFSPFNALGLIGSLITVRTAKRIIAPRGELGRGALNIKATRKKLFLFLYKMSRLQRLSEFHATSDGEAEDIVRELGIEATTVPNIPLLKNSPKTPPVKKPGFAKLVYFSRITRKKNLHLALEALQHCEYGEIIFDIVGPIEDSNYWNECDALIKRMPANITTTRRSPVAHADVFDVLSEYHGLLLPTANENFGHAIVEAMSCGLLPIISDQTPWRKLQSADAGWDVPLQDGFQLVNAIRGLVSLDATDYQRMSTSAKNYIRKQIDVEKIVAAYCNLFAIKKW